MMTQIRNVQLVSILAASLMSVGVAFLTSCTSSSADECEPIVADSVSTVDNGAWVRLASTAAPSVAGQVQMINDQTGFTLAKTYLKTNVFENEYEVEASLQKTTDGGVNWSPVQVPMTSVRFVDANTGWAVGGEGVILKTGNGGGAWTLQSSGTRRNLHSVYFVSSATGYAVGDSGTILKTTNAGINWVAQTSGTKFLLSQVHFMTASIGIAIGNDGVIVLTSNGGTAWKKPASPTQSDLSAVHFRDANNGWIVGWGSSTEDQLLTLKSTDGGKTWKKITAVIPSSLNIGRVSAVQFTGPSTGWALVEVFGGAGLISTLLKTTNGGAAWTLNRQGEDSYDHNGQAGSLFFLDSNNGWYANGETLLITHNAGQTWVQRAGGWGHRPASIHFVNTTTGYAVGAGGSIFKSADGGDSWTLQRGGIPEKARSFFFVDASTGWAVGEAGAIAKTTDGGGLWKVQPSGVTQTLQATHFVNVQEGYVVGSGGVALKTENGGATWSQGSSGTSRDLKAVRFTDASSGFAVGEAGTILRTTNWGETWAALSSGTNRNLTNVHFVDGITGWAVGGGVGSEPVGDVYDENAYWSRGVILKTSTGGDSWVVENSPALKLYSIHFLNASTGYAVGGGPSYVKFPVLSNTYSSYCPDSRPGYFSQILKTVNGGATWVPEQIRLQAPLTSPNFLKSGNPFFSVSCGPSGKCVAAGVDGVWRRP